MTPSVGIRAVLTIAAAALAVAACSPATADRPVAPVITGQPADPLPSVQVGSAPSPATDPYTIYLANNPVPSLVLSREDAQIRAYLGCGQQFAPGTVDAVLADAYADLGLCASR